MRRFVPERHTELSARGPSRATVRTSLRAWASSPGGCRRTPTGSRPRTGLRRCRSCATRPTTRSCSSTRSCRPTATSTRTGSRCAYCSRRARTTGARPTSSSASAPRSGRPRAPCGGRFPTRRRPTSCRRASRRSSSTASRSRSSSSSASTPRSSPATCSAERAAGCASSSMRPTPSCCCLRSKRSPTSRSSA